jgi:hypothetical protein
LDTSETVDETQKRTYLYSASAGKNAALDHRLLK